jgi:hypothetical protein
LIYGDPNDITLYSEVEHNADAALEDSAQAVIDYVSEKPSGPLLGWIVMSH